VSFAELTTRLRRFGASRLFINAAATPPFQGGECASAVASFGMILRDSPHKGNSTLDAVLQTAENSKGADIHAYRGEFVELVRKARDLKQVSK
jgi:hypothetical protein